MRDTIGGYPFETKKDGAHTIIRFFPKGENLKHPDTPKFSLKLSKDDIKKLSKL